MGRAIKWHDDWIREHISDGGSYEDLRKQYNETFDENVSRAGLKNHCRYTLGIQKPRENCRHYTNEQLQFLMENYEKMSNRELLILFNQKFNEHRTMSSMKNFGLQYGLKVNRDVRQKNRRRFIDQNGSKRKMKEAGAVRIESGRLVMKDSDGNWKSATRVIWEKEYGRVPDGYVVTALDGDCFNISLDNLACIPISYMGLLQKNGLRSENAEITKTGIKWCELKVALDQA